MIKTAPLGDDPFGQLSGGLLVLKGMLFGVPDPNALMELDRAHFADDWAFSLDDCGDEYYANDTYFIPLAESPDASRVQTLTICGLLVQYAEQDQTIMEALQRVGFAIVSSTDGDIAGTGWHLKNWVPPPWREDQMRIITMI
jgi:hypothetical protein